MAYLRGTLLTLSTALLLSACAIWPSYFDTNEQAKIAEKYLASNHLDSTKWEQGKLVLTQSGRLIADRIVRELLV